MLSQFVQSVLPTDKYWLVAADALKTCRLSTSKDKGSTVAVCSDFLCRFFYCMFNHLKTTRGFAGCLDSYNFDSMGRHVTKTAVCRLLDGSSSSASAQCLQFLII